MRKRQSVPSRKGGNMESLGNIKRPINLIKLACLTVFSFFALCVCMLLFTGTAQALTGLEKVEINDSVVISINPNKADINYDLPVSDAIPILNNSNGVVKIQIKSIEPLNGGGGPTVVTPNLYTDAEWMNLTKKQTAESIAFGIIPVNGSGWSEQPVSSWIDPSSVGDTSIGIINGFGNVEYMLKAKYGLSYECGTTLSYKINYKLTYI